MTNEDLKTRVDEYVGHDPVVGLIIPQYLARDHAHVMDGPGRQAPVTLLCLWEAGVTITIGRGLVAWFISMGVVARLPFRGTMNPGGH